jgi:hypothetical protein
MTIVTGACCDVGVPEIAPVDALSVNPDGSAGEDGSTVKVGLLSSEFTNGVLALIGVPTVPEIVCVIGVKSAA